MQYWLLKSEPSTWSWQDQKIHNTTKWDGVRNYQARNNLKRMKIDDLSDAFLQGVWYIRNKVKVEIIS